MLHKVFVRRETVDRYRSIGAFLRDLENRRLFDALGFCVSVDIDAVEVYDPEPGFVLYQNQTRQYRDRCNDYWYKSDMVRFPDDITCRIS